MKIYGLVIKLIIILGITGFLSACQVGHSYSSGYKSSLPKQKTKRVMLPKDKPAFKAQPKLSGGTIKVRKGDTIYALSRRHDVTVREIIRANHLKPPYLLYPGQKLKSPGTGHHVVQKGETIYSLSRKYRVDMTSFARLNHLKIPFILSIGQKLKVPGGVISKPRRATLPPPPPRSGKGFMWPVKGPLLSSYGPKAKGYHNDGINIAAKTGSYVRAAESGVVVHAGRKIKGFGQLILLRHSNGWITAYAHNSMILIKKGQSVKRGQAIARVGSSGGVSRPQLHFEMRKGARAVNPVKYLS
ncbi:hypothetical protein MNBD_ALPHA02-1503 [hydrothermal vent metagenome]|uniref:LysM domain-containing protein n=1 Tax=hydrothermal vent metagenome TaxID=652676 RepID=A0A3B0SKH5_9ZZZZ